MGMVLIVLRAWKIGSSCEELQLLVVVGGDVVFSVIVQGSVIPKIKKNKTHFEFYSHKTKKGKTLLSHTCFTFSL